MNKNVNKAFEIKNAKIEFVSLVDKAANKKQFLITKADKNSQTAQFQTYGKIIKTDPKNHYVTGIVYEPLVEDSQGDFMTEEEITKAAYYFAKSGSKIDTQHNFKAADGVCVVESWIAKSDFEIEGVEEPIKKGTWLLTTEVTNPKLWESIEKQEITGYSMGGSGTYSGEDVDLEDVTKADEKQSLLAKLAELLNVKSVAKGEVADKFGERKKSSLFWEAFHSLQSCLCKYNYFTDRDEFEKDETKVREALEDFSAIITDILTTEKSVTKALTADPQAITKAGKKMSSANKEKLASICASLTEFMKEFDEPEETPADDKDVKEKEKKEETDVTKNEVETMIAAAIEKALAKSAEPQPQKAEITPETVQKMVTEAIEKATKPAEDNVTMEQVEEMVTSAVAKAMEPVLKSTGTPSNLNDSQNVEKQETQHYLHGIL